MTSYGTYAKYALAAAVAYKAACLKWPSPVKSLEGGSALVTGAAGSLGSAIVRELADKGVRVFVLWDLSVAPLEKLASELRAKRPELKISCRAVNLAQRDAIYAEAKLALDFCGQALDLVVNNAGVVAGKFLTQNSDDFDRLTFDVNVVAHVWMAKAFLPAMEKRGKGHFCNVSSMASFVATTGMVTYAASKYGARGFAEGLAHELRHRKSPVKITCVCPSQFESKLFDGFFVAGNIGMTAEYVAQRALEGVLCERELVVLPQYLIPALPQLAIWQASGYLGAHLDDSNPMQHWKGGAQAESHFKAALDAKL